MKAFILFSPAFLEWPLAICRTLLAENPGARFCGLVTGPQQAFDRISGAAGLAIEPLFRLDDLERRWIASQVPAGAREAYETKLGADIFQRLTIADQHLGRGYVSGGETPESPLANLAGNPEPLQRYLVGLLDYAFQHLNNARPDLVFCHTVDGAPALALALVAQYLEIPFAQLRHTRIGNRIIVDTTPYDHLEPVRDTFERIVLTNAVPQTVIGPARDYLAAVREGTSVPGYLAFHARRVRRRLRPGKQLRLIANSLRRAAVDKMRDRQPDLRQPSPMTHCAHELKVASRARKLLRNGPFRPKDWRPSEPFAFFPLHVDPESSTMVQSPMHTDQLAVIEAIAKNLPGTMSLLVKEHLPMLGRRPVGFYQRLAKLPGVELASPYELGTSLVRDAALTTTISSTAGWEAMVFGRPVRIAAFPPYAMVNDGFVTEPDLTRFGSAIREALTSPPASESRLLAYVAAALECSFDCPTEIIWGQVTAETVQENPEILTEMVQRLRSAARGDGIQGISTLEDHSTQSYG